MLIFNITGEMKVQARNIFQGGHRQPEKDPFGEGLFKQECYNQKISRGKKSFKLVVLRTCVAMIEEWQIAICRWIVRESMFGMPLHANSLANGLQIHLIVEVPQNILKYLIMNSYSLLSLYLFIKSPTLPKAPPLSIS